MPVIRQRVFTDYTLILQTYGLHQIEIQLSGTCQLYTVVLPHPFRFDSQLYGVTCSFRLTNLYTA